MRDPANIISSDYNEDKFSILQINEIPKFDIEDYDLLDEKDFKKYMKSIEKIVRNSFEYKKMVSFLRENMDMNKCSFYENVNNIDSYKIKIHIHHEPLDLYTICLVVYNKRCANKEDLSEEMIAKEVMYIHYSLLIGLIPLAETVHELVHNKYLFVPTDKVMGKYREFVSMYEEYFMPEQLDLLDKIEKATLEYNHLKNVAVLEKNYIYLDLSNAQILPKYEDIISMMDSRIKTTTPNQNTPVFRKPLRKLNTKGVV